MLFFARCTHVGTRQGAFAPYNPRYRCQRLAVLKELRFFVKFVTYLLKLCDIFLLSLIILLFLWRMIALAVLLLLENRGFTVFQNCFRPSGGGGQRLLPLPQSFLAMCPFFRTTL